MSTPTQTPRADALITLCQLYLAAIGRTGRSSGEVYAHAMTAGITCDQHLKTVDGLAKSGLVEKRGDWLALTELGADALQAINRQFEAPNP